MARADLKGAQAELNGRVLGKPGVEGTAIGLHRGSPCLKVYVSSPAGSKVVPSKVGGFRVVTERTGGFRKLS
ncbi:MAG: hypothetical protein OEN56_03280 [Gemmatimonadota bacterium]|nr:hypothetical protein [Gemmatimonadota bacterium]